MSDPTNDEERDRALVAEATRIYLRYEVEVVEAFSICPWAERARLDGRTRQRVVLHAEPEIEHVLEGLDALAPVEQVEIGFLIFPRCRWPRPRFERFVSAARQADQARGPVFATAAFHPDAEAHLDEPYRLVPFLRRSPDPTIQLVRQSTLESVRRPGDGGTGYVDPTSITDLEAFFRNPPKPPLHERVAEANLATVTRVGVDVLEAIFADIAADRARSYAAIMRGGAETPPR